MMNNYTYYFKNYFLVISFLTSLNSYAQTTNRAEASLCAPNIMSYYFGVENLTIAKRVRTLDSLKMDGVMVQVSRRNLAELDEYYATKEVRNGSFHVYDIWTTINVEATDANLVTAYSDLEAICAKIQNKETVLQVIFGGVSTRARITKIVSEAADIAKKYDKDLIIYPHHGHTMSTSEIALSYIQATKKSNLFLAVHLCHELKAGFGNRIKEVVQNVSLYIKSASISGATLSEMSDPDFQNWKWGIKPLNMGTYDLSTYYNALHSVGYKGPIAIHTFGIIKNFGLYSQDHLSGSRTKLLQLANKACLATSIEETFGSSDLNGTFVYPNPSNNGIFNLSQSADWKVSTVLGKEILSGKGQVVNLSEHPKGVYFIKMNYKIERVVVE